MVFSSIPFIYYFLPLVLLIYFIIPRKYKNFWLFLSSLLFYFYGEKIYTLILISSSILNYYSGKLIYKHLGQKRSKYIFIGTIIINLSFLIYFKYTNFLLDNINVLFKTHFHIYNLIMPIGISFFTFQAISYIIDIYNKKITPATNYIDFACSLVMFPQLVAGPIVRYKDINTELKSRHESFFDFGEGVKLFIIGLAKKVLIANIIGEMITDFSNLNELSILAYFLITLGYTLQIYFDFSGYSDMAIGLGRMFGFHFPINFNYPLCARSITDFWRRWHITLSSFFRDYIYIPLGGNKTSTLKHIRNILIVWFLTGLWHGASWNFIVWGLYFGIILIIEKYFLKSFLEKHKIVGRLYTLIIILISFLIFSLDSIQDITIFLKNMFNFKIHPFINSESLYYFKSYFIIILISILASTPILNIFKGKKSHLLDTLEVGSLIILLLVITAFLIDSSFNPFLYFRF